MREQASPFTVRLQFTKVGAPIDGDPMNGFAESEAFDLEHQRIPMQRHLTWALADAEGARLCTEPA